MPTSQHRPNARSRRMSPTSARATSRRSATPTRSPTRSWSRSRPGSASGPAAPHDPDAEDEEHQRPGDESELHSDEDGIAAPAVGAAAAEEIVAVEREANWPDEHERERQRSR